MDYRDIVGKGLTVSNAVKPAKNAKSKSKIYNYTLEELKVMLSSNTANK